MSENKVCLRGLRHASFPSCNSILLLCSKLGNEKIFLTKVEIDEVAHVSCVFLVQASLLLPMLKVKAVETKTAKSYNQVLVMSICP